jgi:hypothetical protein
MTSWWIRVRGCPAPSRVKIRTAIRGRRTLVALALAIGVKFLPVILMPLFCHIRLWEAALGVGILTVPYIPFLAHGQLPLGKDSVPLRTLVRGLTSLDAPTSTQRIRAGGTTISTSPVAMSQTRPEMNHSAGNAETARSAATSMATAERGSVIAFVLSSPSWI